jgi:hypothetical protein
VKGFKKVAFKKMKGMQAGETREFEEGVELESTHDFIATVVPLYENKKEGQAKVSPSILKNGKHYLKVHGPARIALTQASAKVQVNSIQ